jgi:uncharacterized membrane protein
MTDRPDDRARALTRRLGWASIALAVPQLARPDAVARAAGVDDAAEAPNVVFAVGARELLHAVALLAGPSSMIWTRVAGDALDLTVLNRARSARRGERRSRASAATAVVAAITALDLYAAVRSSRAGQHGKGRPGPLKVDASISVNRPPQEVYDYWRDFERLPTFMRHLQSVTVGADGRSHWKADAPIRRSVEWDAELTGDEPGRRLSWKSLRGADIDNSGTVHFAPTPDGSGTEVRVNLHYDLPGGAVGRAVAKLLGEEPDQQVRDDLRRFKQVLETGDVVRSDALPQGTDARHQVIQRPAQPVRSKEDAR